MRLLLPWVPLEVRFALTTLPGMGNDLIIASKSMRDHLAIDVLATLKDGTVREATTNMSADDVVRAAVESREDHLRSERISKLGPVQATLGSMQVEADKQALPEARNGIKDALIVRGPAMFMDPSEERLAGVKALQGTLAATIAAGMDPVAVKRLSLVVLETLGEAFRRER